MTNNPMKSRGFGLVEVLIGMVVLSLGLIAVGGVHTDFLRNLENDKARTEAMLYSSQALAEVRSFVTDTAGWDGLADNNFSAQKTVNGEHGTYTVSTAFSPSSVTDKFEGRTVTVTTSWSGIFGGDSVVLDSSVVPLRPTTVQSIAANGADPANTNLIGTPEGGAKYGDGRTLDEYLAEKNETLSEENQVTAGDPVENTIEGDVTDGTQTVEASDGTFYLIDADENVLLESNDPFVTISGRLYLEQSWEELNLDGTQLWMGAPDVSVCRTVHDAGTYTYTTTEEVPICTEYFTNGKKAGECKTWGTASTGTDINYNYGVYQCYVGADWYGRIGVTDVTYEGGDTILVDNSATCVGEPSNTDSGTAGDLFTTYPQNSITRRYEGYQIARDDDLDGDGDSRVVDAEGRFKVEVIGTPQCSGVNECGIGRHDFVVSELANSCPTIMPRMTGTNGIPSTNANDDSYNPGKRYCLEGDFCPESIDELYAKEFTFKVKLEGTNTPAGFAISAKDSGSTRSVTCSDSVTEDAVKECTVYTTTSESSGNWVSDDVFTGTVNVGTFPTGCTGESSTSVNVTSANKSLAATLTFEGGDQCNWGN